MTAPAVAQRVPRSSVSREQTWDLQGLYPDLPAWETDLARVDALLPEITPFRGRLGESSASLLACLTLRDQIEQLAHRVYWFALNSLSEDQADAARQMLNDRATAMVARVNATLAFIEPELLALPAGTVEGFLEADPALTVYRLNLTDVLDQKEHMLGQEAEEVLASMTELFQAPYDIWRNTTNADISFDPVVDEHGHTVPMSLSALGNLLQSPDRDVRRAAYESAQRAYAAHKRTLAAEFARAEARRHSVTLAPVSLGPGRRAGTSSPAGSVVP